MHAPPHADAASARTHASTHARTHLACARPAQASNRAATADGSGGTGGGESREKLDELVVAAAAAKASKRSWDVSALLNDDQRQAVAELAELFAERPLARAEWNVPPPPEGAEDGGGADALPAEELSIAALYRKLGEAQEGADVFDEDDLSDVRDHHARMMGIVQLCDKIVGLLTIVEQTLVGLQDQHNSVVDKTSALHAECETLLHDKLALEAMANTIQTRLKVYDELEGLQRQLGHPDFGVTSEAFMPVLIQTDEALAQLSNHATFADSPAYLHRFRQVQGRLLGLVQAHVTGLLQNMTDKILLNSKSAGAAPGAGGAGGGGGAVGSAGGGSGVAGGGGGIGR